MPVDLESFGRCWRLLEVVPEIKNSFPDIYHACPPWRRLLLEWETLAAEFQTCIDSHGQLRPQISALPAGQAFRRSLLCLCEGGEPSWQQCA